MNIFTILILFTLIFVDIFIFIIKSCQSKLSK